MRTVLRITGQQHAQLRKHLFPGDGNEAVAVALCGRAGSVSGDDGLECERRAICLHKIVLIPYEQCLVRTPDRVTWSTELVADLLPTAAKRDMAILKIHSHPGDYRRFSHIDDESDRDLFASVYGWTESAEPHASAVMLPDGRLFARTIDEAGVFEPIEMVSVAGVDLLVDRYNDVVGAAPGPHDQTLDQLALRTLQAFGKGTVQALKHLSVAVIGTSGTGSPTVEMLARLSTGELVLVDDDKIEDKNRGRILHSLPEHAKRGELKVNVLADAVRMMDTGTTPVPIAQSLWNERVVRRLALCDVVVGCMDTYDGRELLNRLAAYYCIPYIDIGVRLDADGNGGVDQICGSVHYLQPDGSSLMSRNLFTADDVRTAVLYRSDPEEYRAQVKAGYLHGVNEDRPAVISVNMLFASLAVNELLARIHRFRDDGNADVGSTTVSLTQMRMLSMPHDAPCPALAKKAGRGDTIPLLDVPELSVRR